MLLALSLTASSVNAQQVKIPAELSETQLMDSKRKLRDLGYWIEVADGLTDEHTLAAIAAFRRVNGYENSGPPNARDLLALRNANPRKVRVDRGPHFEVDIRRQILFFVTEEGRVILILPVSTGSGGTFVAGGRTRFAKTPRGTFAVVRKAYGWHESPLGQMYYPSFIVGGVAIHGSAYVADYPRTHGCIAVPLFAAEKLSELMPVGTIVIVRG